MVRNNIYDNEMKIMIHKVAVITGARSEYGILKPLLEKLKAHPKIELSLIVTGMHLSPEFGFTEKQIIDEGFLPAARVEMLLSSDSKVSVAKSIAIGILGLVEKLADLKPDFAVVLGDRFEMFAASVAAIHAGCILAHISGGDVASGVFDNYYRHCITKMAQIHFASTPLSMQRVLLMGADPQMTFLTGSLSYDAILHGESPQRIQVSNELGIDASKPWALAIYHPTKEKKQSLEEFEAMISALKKATVEFNLNVLLLYPNADPGGRIIIEKLKQIQQEGWIIHQNLPRNLYIGYFKESKFIIGNSSSGIVEAAAIGCPVINIGARQEGRERAGNTIDVEGDELEIFNTIKQILSDKQFERILKNAYSPYGDGNASIRILNVLLHSPKGKSSYSTSFHDNIDLILKLKKLTKISYKSFEETASNAIDLSKPIRNDKIS